MPRVSFCLLKIASVYIPLYEIEIHTSRGLLPPRARRACSKRELPWKKFASRSDHAPARYNLGGCVGLAIAYARRQDVIYEISRIHIRDEG